MFGKRSPNQQIQPAAPAPAVTQAAPAPRPAPAAAAQPAPQPAARPRPSGPQARAQAPVKPVSAAKPKPCPAVSVGQDRSAEYYAVKTTIFNALIDTIDLGQLARLDNATAAEEIRDIVTEIISIKERGHVDCRAGTAPAGHLQRCAGLWSAGAASGARRHRRHHGQWRGRCVHRGRWPRPEKPISASATMPS